VLLTWLQNYLLNDRHVRLILSPHRRLRSTEVTIESPDRQ
jgi:hypothetical protein